MTTLRRELIKRITQYMSLGYSYLSDELKKELIEKLADSILELRGFQKLKTFSEDDKDDNA